MAPGRFGQPANISSRKLEMYARNSPSDFSRPQFVSWFIQIVYASLMLNTGWGCIGGTYPKYSNPSGFVKSTYRGCGGDTTVCYFYHTRCPDADASSLAIAENYFGTTRGEFSWFPFTRCFDFDPTYLLQYVLFFFNGQHDCKGLKCPAVDGAETVIQECAITGLKQTAGKHVDTEIYFLNMVALHNAHLIRDTLPRSLTEPIPISRIAKPNAVSLRL